MIPMASALADIRAMAASLFILLFSVILSRKNAARTTTGMDILRGDQPMARATDNAPKDTWDNPSPIMEYRFNTRLTPRREAHRDTSIPPTSALTRKGYDNISLIILIVSPPSRQPYACGALGHGSRPWACTCPVPSHGRNGQPPCCSYSRGQVRRT